MKTAYKILFILAVSGCMPDKQAKNIKERIKRVVVHKQTPLKISIQPFSDLSPELTASVLSGIKSVYPFSEVRQAIPLPKSTYYAPRNRYKADLLIDFLAQHTSDGYVTIGLTSKDISTAAHGYPDFGVMGLGLCPGKACVVSTHRLDKKNLKDQLYKVAIHELGHTQGLPHCPDKTCFMADAEGKNPTNQETGFCPICKAKLQKKGWQL